MSDTENQRVHVTSRVVTVAALLVFAWIVSIGTKSCDVGFEQRLTARTRCVELGRDPLACAELFR